MTAESNSALRVRLLYGAGKLYVELSVPHRAGEKEHKRIVKAGNDFVDVIAAVNDFSEAVFLCNYGVFQAIGLYTAGRVRYVSALPAARVNVIDLYKIKIFHNLPLPVKIQSFYIIILLFFLQPPKA